MCFGGAKEHAIGNDAGAATADFEHLRKQCNKEQFGFSGLTQPQQVFAYFFLEHTTGKGRVRHDERILIPFGILARQRILISDMRIFHTVEHHVHSADSQHGLVSIKAGEQAGFEVAHVLGFHQFLFLLLADIGCTGQKKTGRAHGGSRMNL